ncbi:hypothetical protein [Flavobacterium panacagri]|uniref:hypothetical protein n=1 Tax=Flavobacterium panacagri TaxID=3034146 RepID=UPI0025A5572B|nr:hypothetical protein [Flavobacterium panacagri]
MKAINYLNYFFVGIPAWLFFIGFLDTNTAFSGYTASGMLFSILTGVFQMTIGGNMLKDEPNDKNLQMYTYGVVFYILILLFINPFLPDYFFKKYFIFGMPTFLALYLSVIIYKKAHQ